jgi:hypothetical protein
MVRLRSKTGATQELPEDYRFVEICDADGCIARLLYQDDAGAIHTVDAQDPRAARYCATFKTEFCPLIPIPR